jgi:hypothetical protein
LHHDGSGRKKKIITFLYIALFGLSFHIIKSALGGLWHAATSRGLSPPHPRFAYRFGWHASVAGVCGAASPHGATNRSTHPLLHSVKTAKGISQIPSGSNAYSADPRAVIYRAVWWGCHPSPRYFR